MAISLALALLLQATDAQPAPGSVTSPAAKAKPAMGTGPASTVEIVDALKTCVNGVVPGDFQPSVFKADGWLPGGRRASSVNGTPTQLLPYGKPGGRVINVVQIYNIVTSCITTAQLGSANQLSEIKAAMATAFGAKSFDEFSGDDAFKAAMLKQNPQAKDVFLLTRNDRFLIELIDEHGKSMIKIMTSPKRSDAK